MSKAEKARRRDNRKQRKVHRSRWRDEPARMYLRELGIDITWEHLEVAPEQDAAMTALPEETRQDLFDQLQSDAHAGIKRLRPRVEQYPESRTLRNWLAAGLVRVEDWENGEREARLAYERHPNYLFAKLAMTQICLKRGELDQIPILFDNKLDLKLLYPQRDVFHITELRGFARLMSEYFLRVDRQQEAKRLYAVMKQVEPNSEATRQIKLMIEGAPLLRLAELFGKDADVVAKLDNWNFSGLDDWPTEAIFLQLREMGIDTGIEQFHEQATAAGSFKSLEDQWYRQVPRELSDGRDWGDFPWMAVEVLWQRLAQDVFCPELIDCSLHTVVQAEEDDKALPDVNGRPADLDAALKLADYLKSVEPPQRAAHFERIAQRGAYDYVEWLLDLIASRGMSYPDEITFVADAVSECTSGSQLQGALAAVLAEAGRRDEALARVERNLQRYSDDPWTAVYAGDVYAALDDSPQAIRFWTDALPRMRDEGDWDGVADRLRDEMWAQGLIQEFELLLTAYPRPRPRTQALCGQPVTRPLLNDPAVSFEPAAPPSRPSVRIGRNDPCPCGSGKKYKKCCLK